MSPSSSASAARGLVRALQRARGVPARSVPALAAHYAVRRLRARARRLAIERNRGELSDAAFLRALGGRFRTSHEAQLHFRTRTAPSFFITPAQARERALAIASGYPRLADRTRASADAALRHCVDLLGTGPTLLGERIDWHTDWTTGYSWPRSYYEDVDYVALDRRCDVKLPWELSRGYQLVALGRAYALDPRPAYAHECASQIEAWLDDNPWPYGVNWGRAMEVAIRAVNWIWSAAFFAEAPAFTDRARLRLLKALVQHGRHIAANLEYAGPYSGNHYFSNGVGLAFLGILYPELREAAGWRRTGLGIVFGELQRQVLPDGVDFEMGIGYQGLVCELAYSTLLLCDLNAIPVPEAARQRLARMFDFMLAYTRPDGTFPQIGDNDDGRLAGLDDEPVGSHRRHLAVGGAMFQRADLLAATGESIETAVWHLGPAVLQAERSEPRPDSRAFPHGGFYVLRGSDSTMVVDAGPVGLNGIGGHGHNDALSFDLWAAGTPLLVDPGTYVYTADPAARQEMRATAAHNTLRVDGQEINRLGGIERLWHIWDDARPRVRQWESDGRRDLLEAEHSGYTRLPEPVVHRRRILFDKQQVAWIVQDTLEGRGEHGMELFLHPGVTPADRSADLAVRLAGRDADLWIVPLQPPPGLALDTHPGWISRGYGHREPAVVLRYHLRARVPLTLTTGLALVPRGAPLDEAKARLARAEGV